ncbi:endonuclease/exonuclease/phosphatase family protein [Cryobacterium sp. M91]|uniref:endonuclease/exonuclease/phosphatase family protein n=1 Tax=Cryobacterium sp. M91 TaxID=2048294 RepID=UPI0035140554
MVAASMLPTIVTGDFNTDANTAPFDRITGQGLLLDTWKTAEERLTEEWGTFLNYRLPRRNLKRIDWLLVTPSATVLKAAINVTHFEGDWPSDHAAIQAVVNLAGTAPRLERRPVSREGPNLAGL